MPSNAPSLGAGGKESLPCPKGDQDGYQRQGADPHLEPAKIPTDHPLSSTYQHSFLLHCPGIAHLPCLHALFEAAEAQYHQREHVLQMPGRLHLDEEFNAEENVHADIPKKPITDCEGATSNDLTVQASNLSSGKGDKEEKETTRMGPLTFDVNLKLEEDEHVYLAAVDDQAKLMRWHYCLGHLSFFKLKQLVLNVEIP